MNENRFQILIGIHQQLFYYYYTHTSKINVSPVLHTIFFHLGVKNALFDPLVEKIIYLKLILKNIVDTLRYLTLIFIKINIILRLDRKFFSI